MKMYVSTENHGTLNMRSAPSKESSVITKIPYGAELSVEKVDDTWAKTTYNGKEGYVMEKYLSDIKIDVKIDKAALQKIYESLKQTLQTIEEVLK